MAYMMRCGSNLLPKLGALKAHRRGLILQTRMQEISRVPQGLKMCDS